MFSESLDSWLILWNIKGTSSNQRRHAVQDDLLPPLRIDVRTLAREALGLAGLIVGILAALFLPVLA